VSGIEPRHAGRACFYDITCLMDHRRAKCCTAIGKARSQQAWINFACDGRLVASTAIPSDSCRSLLQCPDLLTCRQDFSRITAAARCIGCATKQVGVSILRPDERRGDREPARALGAAAGNMCMLAGRKEVSAWQMTTWR
jgi:hypothetical protein